MVKIKAKIIQKTGKRNGNTIIKKEKTGKTNGKTTTKSRSDKNVSALKNIDILKESKINTDELKFKRRYVLPSKYITAEIVNSCLKALNSLEKHYKEKSKNIFDEDTPILAEINCIKIPRNTGKITFKLQHSTVSSTGEVCLITKDLKKGKKRDHEPTAEYWEELLRKAEVKNVKTIMPFRQLRVEYDQFELKRRLMTQHDFIMVDTRILKHASYILGKKYFKKHNMLIPVRINENDIKKSIDTGLKTAILRINDGATSTITVGHTGMNKDHVKDNILAIVEQLRKKYPGGEVNIRSICIKLPLSLSLPLYVTLRPSKLVRIPKLSHSKPKQIQDVEDELSTIPGARVRVCADGTVHVIRTKVGSGSESEEMQLSDDEEVSEKEEE